VISLRSTEIYFTTTTGLCLQDALPLCVHQVIKVIQHVMYCSYRKKTAENSTVYSIQKRSSTYISKVSDD